MNKRYKMWIKAAAVRAIKTVFQTAGATISSSALISQIDWRMVLSASASAGVLSLITSLAGLPEIKNTEE